MQQMLLVTIQGPQRTIDVTLPGDVPLYELFPFLVDICSAAKPSFTENIPLQEFVSLSAERLQEILAPTCTLKESGMLDGDILCLQIHTDAAPAVSFASEIIKPGGTSKARQKE